jgi:hypothetical protein
MPRATKAVQEAARRIVRIRDGHQCQMCGRSIVDYPSSIHHRINKGSGGSAKLERPSLLIRMCGTGTTGCHGYVTEHPKDAAATGWILPKNNPDIEPTTEPVLTYLGWFTFDDEGGKHAHDWTDALVGEAYG